MRFSPSLTLSDLADAAFFQNIRLFLAALTVFTIGSLLAGIAQNLDQLIAAHLGSLFPGMEVVEAHSLRVTRDADLIARARADATAIVVITKPGTGPPESSRSVAIRSANRESERPRAASCRAAS